MSDLVVGHFTVKDFKTEKKSVTSYAGKISDPKDTDIDEVFKIIYKGAQLEVVLNKIINSKGVSTRKDILFIYYITYTGPKLLFRGEGDIFKTKTFKMRFNSSTMGYLINYLKVSGYKFAGGTVDMMDEILESTQKILLLTRSEEEKSNLVMGLSNVNVSDKTKKMFGGIVGDLY